MLNLSRIYQDARLMRATIGMPLSQFKALVPSFRVVYERSQLEYRPMSERQRALGGGRKARLASIEDKLFYILFYLKCYPTFDLLSILFNFDRACAHDWVHRLLPILEETLGEKQVLPARKMRSIEEFMSHCPGVGEVIIDGTERPIQRPKAAERQNETYSGKKKRHTRKHITVGTSKKKILVLTPARDGSIHDKRQLDEAELLDGIPLEVLIKVDLGFQGLQTEVENLQLPHKKPRHKELTPEQKQQNKDFNRERVKIEHAHAGMKRFRAVTDVYRNRVTLFDDRLMVVSAGLWNDYLEVA
jgi:hypothetical protein